MTPLSDELMTICRMSKEDKITMRLHAASRRAALLERDLRRMVARLQNVEAAMTEEPYSEAVGVVCETPTGQVVHVDFPNGRVS